MASTSSARTSSSSSFTTLFKHDVFLSFYGKDTRNSFTDHLYTTLKEKGIDVFRDDEKLERGTFINPELMKAIEESKFAIVVLSENYATSRWCLDELDKIVVCMEETGLTVLPIFYHVDPSDVRQQTGTYAVAFAEHEKNSKVNTEKIQTWKEALKRVGNIAGWDVKDRPESKVIQEIIGRIRSQLNRKIVTVRKDLVAMNSRKKEMITCFNLGLDNVRFIGIWGMGGVGKTTLIKVMYNTVYSQFEASSFIGHVSEKARNRGLVPLQKQLLYEILMEKKLKIFDVDEGTDWLRKRLQKIKVLIVLDDVDEDKQLEALAGSHDWFGLGSRIIMTSRDKHLLKRKVDYIYEAKKLDHDDALELFSQRAFNKPYPKKDYVDLSNKFVTYAKGLPLALEVLGSSLFGRTRKAWEDALDDLKENPNKEIMDILVVGYQKLKPTAQNLFLDIACFFKGEDKDRVADLLKGSCYNMDVAILEDRSLITILGKKLWMHDLLQEMGRDIVRCEAPQEPGRRSRLWHYKDTFSVLRNNTGTKSVEGMVLNSYPPTEDLNVHTTFSGMERLRLIRIITNVHLPRGLNYLSNELRLMEWHKYPLKYMPRSFEPKNLVELIMPHSCIKQLPEGFGNLENLKLMDLSDSQYIIKTPNFKGFPNIERLIFQGCTRLYVVHSSIGALKHLTLLNLKDCKCLNRFPHEINLESLSFLILSGCSRFKKFPEVGSNMTRLSNLYLNGTAIEELPLSIKHLTGLTLLNLRECKNLSKCPSIVCSLTSLTALNLSGCKGQAPKFMHLFGLCSCAEFVSWGYGFFIDHHLGEEPINMLVPKSFSGLRSLLSLDLSDCNLSDTAFPKDLSCLSSLQYLDLSKNNFTCLPHSFSQISQLKFLYLDNCTRLQSFANLPLSTEIVMARECTSLENFSNQVVIWPSGETTFTFINCLSWDKDEKCRTSDFPLVGKHFQEAEDEEFRNSEVSLVDIRFQRLRQIYMMERIYQSNVFYRILPQTEIREWFNYQSSMSSVKILLTSNSNWKGIAICAIFVVDKNLIDASPCQDSEYFHEFICHFAMDGDPVDCPIVLNIPKDKYSIGSFGVEIYISHSRSKDYLEKCSYISSSITTNSPIIKIRKCNGRILSEKDMVEFLQDSDAQSPTLRSAPSRLNKIGRRPIIDGFNIFVSGLIEIPEWFSHRSPAGSSVKIPLSSNLCDNNSWSGIAFFAISVPPKNLKEDIFHGKELLLSIEATCHSDMFGGLENCPQYIYPLNMSNVYRNISFGHGSYIPAEEIKDYLDENSFITVSITSNAPHLDFKCGARKVHVDDLTEFEHVINNLHLGSSTEDHSAVSCQRYSTQSLESLLLGLHQGDWAKNHKYDYIIPYISVPACFHHHSFCSSIRIRLPENLNIDERWLGIAVCASYTVDKQLAGYDDHKDLTSFLCFYNPLPNHQIRLTRHKVFQDSEDIFVDSTHRILVYYIPQMLFRLRGCSHIEASFEPKNPGVKVKECGIQLVFEQNVQEFVQTLVQCMLRCPDAYHEFFYHNLLSRQNERKSCFDNGKDNGCSSSSQRMRQPMPNIAERCTSPESFSNPQIDVGTSRNFSPSVTGFLIPTRKAQHGSIMSSESSIKACLQKNCEDGEILHGYSAEREIPEWFRIQTNGNAVALLMQPQLQELCNDPDLMGLALCGLFHFTRHPTAVRKNFDSRTIDREFKCFLQSSSCPRRLVCFGLLSECNELISSVQRAFIWVLFIPYTAHSHLWSQSTWFDYSFHSCGPDLSGQSCGIKLVYRKDMEELTRIMARYASSSPFDRTFLDNTRDPKTVYEAWDYAPKIFIEATSSSEYLHPQRLFISPGETSGTAQYSYEDDPYPDNRFRYFHPSTPYNFCFPTRRTLKWFNHQSRGYSISIDITSNLYDDSNWMGLAVYASFSIEREYRTIFKNMVSTFSPHFLYCQFELSRASLNQIHVCRINYEENQWLHNLYGFSWISYIPGEAFKDVLNQCDHMKASFVSDWPGVIVQKCGLHLLYQHDRLQFEREVQHCNTLISAYQDFERWLRKERIKHCGLDRISEIMDTRTPNKMKLGLDGCFEYFGCFPLVNVLRSFSSQSNGPSVTIYVPKYFYNDIDWMGLVLCANFSIQEHQTAILENPNSTISHHLICLLETDVAGSEHLLVHLTNNEEFIWLDTEGQFLWLSCISRGLLPDEFNQSGCIKASIISDWPGVMVQKCGLSFFHVNDDLFREMRYRCEKQYIFQNFINQMTAGKLKMKQDHDDETGPRRTSSSNEDQIHHEITRRPIDKGETSEAKDQHSQSNLLDFDHHLVHNFCFGGCECLRSFSNQNDSPSLTINSIRNLCSDNTWLGFALCAFFELNEDQNSILDILDSETSYNLICHLETNIGSVKPRHIHCPTKKDLMLSQTGGFFWLSYIPRGSLPDWLNHCILAKFSFATNCPGLTAQKCGLLPLYKHTGQICDDGSEYKLCERQFKEILTYHVKSWSDNWNIIWKLTIDNTNKRRQKHDNEARPSTSGSSNEDSHPERRTEHVDPMLKDKGKRVLE